MLGVGGQRPTDFDFDLIVIGTGAGGGVAAHAAVSAGKKVAVIEAEKVGGECPNFGCVPTKALLQAAETYEIAKHGGQLGVQASNVSFNYPAIKAWKDLAVRHTGTSEGEQAYASEHITLISGHAHFLSPWTISVGRRRYNAHKFLIATGTKQIVPPIPGLAETGFITYREAIDLIKPPKSLFVIGGGAIGCEFTQLFNTFGTTVHLADFAPRLIGQEDPEVGELLEALFASRGITVHTSARITRIVKKGSKKIVYFEKDGQTHEASVEQILLSTGKAPNTDLGLDNAGVSWDHSGITVNRFMQTSSKHIYAAGDVVGPFRFTHTASYQSRIAAHNMFHTKKKFSADYKAVPRCVFVDPEIACVGATEQRLREDRFEYQVGAVPISLIGRSNTSNMDTGFVKVLADRYGVLLGASIVCPRAGEMIHELTLAIQHGLRAQAIVETIHAFPTWSEAVRLACQKIKSR